MPHRVTGFYYCWRSGITRRNVPETVILDTFFGALTLALITGKLTIGFYFGYYLCFSRLINPGITQYNL